VRKKCCENIVGKKCDKSFSIYTRISCPKKRGQRNVSNNFFRNTRIVRKKNVGKKLSEKRRKNVFYIHTNIVTKKWGQKNARNNYSRNTQIVRAKNVGKKIVCKNCEKTFFIFTRISSPKNGDKKIHESIFSETHDFCELKMLGKNRL